MFCKSCGHEIDIDSIYCSFCGVKQPESNKPQQTTIQTATLPTIENIKPSVPVTQQLVTPPDLEIKANNKSSLPDNFLDDIDLIHKSLRRPNTVNISIFLQVVMIIYSLVSLVLGMIANSISGIQAFGILVSSIWLGSLANSIFFRRKKARITYCVLISLRIGLIVFLVLLDANVYTTLKVEYFCIVAVDFTATILLFTESATKWFKADRENIFSADPKSNTSSPL